MSHQPPSCFTAEDQAFLDDHLPNDLIPEIELLRKLQAAYLNALPKAPNGGVAIDTRALRTIARACETIGVAYKNRLD